jgi:hypothetical protein
MVLINYFFDIKEINNADQSNECDEWEVNKTNGTGATCVKQGKTGNKSISVP